MPMGSRIRFTAAGRHLSRRVTLDVTDTKLQDGYRYPSLTDPYHRSNMSIVSSHVTLLCFEMVFRLSCYD